MGMSRKWLRTQTLAAFLILLQPLASHAARQGPIPPCEDGVLPAYAAPGAPLNVQVWFGEHLEGKWSPPPCTDWASGSVTILVASAGRFHYDGGVEALLERIGAISRLTTIRYWSVTRGRWHQLIPEAFALSTADRKSRRADFSGEELRPGRTLYFWQEESSSAGSAIYQLRVLTREPDRLVVAMENTEPVRLALLTLFEPGEYRFLYFLERESPVLWRYYSLFRAVSGPSLFANQHEKSYINRAVAVYRHLAGIQTDRDPPPAP